MKPSKRREFYTNYHQWFPSPSCEEHREEFVETMCNGKEWVPLECCVRRLKDDKFTPGLFKVGVVGELFHSALRPIYVLEETQKLQIKRLKSLQKG